VAELAHPARIRDLLLTKADSGDGQSFHVVSERAMTLRGYAEAVAAWFGQQAKVRYLPFSEFRRMTLAEHADLTWAHIARRASIGLADCSAIGRVTPHCKPSLMQWLQRHGEVDIGPDELTV
jgi:hypothetical protein